MGYPGRNSTGCDASLIRFVGGQGARSACPGATLSRDLALNAAGFDGCGEEYGVPFPELPQEAQSRQVGWALGAADRSEVVIFVLPARNVEYS